jgi:hypothetical protein
VPDPAEGTKISALREKWNPWNINTGLRMNLSRALISIQFADFWMGTDY